MKFRPHGLFPCILALALAIVASTTTAHAQPTVTIAVPTPTATPFTAPKAPFTVTASISSGTATKVVFYRNNVPVFTSYGPTFAFTEPAELGQDTYTYRARAFDSAGDYSDSPDAQVRVVTRFVFRMGQEVPAFGSHPAPMQTYLGYRYLDQSDEIQRALDYLAEVKEGGTLFFPCTPPIPGDANAVYNIKKTIRIPANVTLAGESAEGAPNGRCQIFWVSVPRPGEPNPYPNPDDYGCNATPEAIKIPMFKIDGVLSANAHVRLRDLSLRSMSSGPNCYPRVREMTRYFDQDIEQIATDNTVAVMIEGNVSDVILENVSIVNFSYGVKAVATGSSAISNVKVRGVQMTQNNKQLSIDAALAYDWDLQNLNITGMWPSQNGVDILNAGRPASYGSGSPIKFLQLNCNGGAADQGYCVKIAKHGGLYFKQLHHEGIEKGFQVEPLASGTNDYPIVAEGSVMTGEFRDASMKLYLIGNGVFAAPLVAGTGYDNGRMRFYGQGANATIVDCGDLHGDWTDTNFDGLPTVNDWNDLRMLYTHTERSRASFFHVVGTPPNEVYYNKGHTTCPSGLQSRGFTNINEIGGEYFNTGIMPTEDLGYANRLDVGHCNPAFGCNPGQKLTELLALNGTVYVDLGVDEGPWLIDRTITVPSGRQIVGAPGAHLVLAPPDQEDRPHFDFFKIVIPVGTSAFPRAAGTVFRNLKLSTGYSNSTAIALVGTSSGTAGSSSDMHFTGLTIEGFEKGITAGPYVYPASPSPTPTPTPPGNPMIDGVSWKNISLVNNKTAVEITSSNVSNWNVANISMQSNSAGAVGWTQVSGGHSIQNVSCTGTQANKMVDCLKVRFSGSSVIDMRKPTYVNNAVTIDEGLGLPHTGIFTSIQTSHLAIRDSDLRSSAESTAKMNVLGKSFIVSMNNKYTNINIGPATEANLSRVTHCGDTYPNNAAYPTLLDNHPSYFFGVPMPTRVKCGDHARPWEDTFVHGGQDGDVPLAGNFTDTAQDDYVIYRPGLPSEDYHSKFLIRPFNQNTTTTITWGLSGSSGGAAPDVPLIGRFHPNRLAQITVWRPGDGSWWAWDPNTSTHDLWFWGNGPVHNDRPFVGNFIDESATAPPSEPPPPAGGGNKDEIAVYRPANGVLYIMNPRNGRVAYVYTGITDSVSNPQVKIQVADFLGLNYDQVALFVNGTWTVFDPRNPWTTFTPAIFGTTGDIPVAGKYLDRATGFNDCAQLAYWHPATQEFVVKDPPFSNCPSRSERRVHWGSTNSFTFAPPGDPGPNCPLGDCPACPNGDCADDIVFTISNKDGLRRPAAYRPTNSSFYPHTKYKGQWWIHNTLPETP